MFRYDANDSEVLEMILLGTVIRVERYGSPIQVLTLTFTDGRRVNLAASDDDLVIGEDNLPQC